MKHYPKYKDSGIDWLGEIPEHWEIVPAFVVFKEQCFRNKNLAEKNLLSLSYGKIVRKDFEANFGLLPESFETYQIVMPGNIILRLTDLQNDKKSLRVGLVKERGIITSAYLCLQPKNIYEKYVYTLLHNYDILKVFYNMGSGIRQNMAFKDLKRLPILVPTVEEQKHIVRFIDRKLEQINHFISNKQRLIELLKEQKTAIINRAVTKGLNPHTPMKPSGIEWLGEIPEHWKVKRLGWICSEINDINHEMPPAVAEGVPFLSAKDLLDDGTLNFIHDIKMISEEDFQKLSKKVLPRKNDIIYSRIGARLGKARIVKTDTKFLISYSCCVVRVKQEIAIPELIKLILDSEFVLTEAKLRTVGVGVPDLGLREIARFPIPLPPIKEQEKITKYLIQEIANIDLAIAKIEKEIELIQEYRTTLISDAVTGKIDVRDTSVVETTLTTAGI